MLMTEETKAKMNEILTNTFLLNMICDNCVYEIDYAVYPKISKIVHENFAHYWPGLADEISELMIKLDARPERANLVKSYEDHGGDIAAIFKEIVTAVEGYRKEILDLIEIADLNEDAEVRIKGEEILMAITPYRKQAEIWLRAAERYTGDYKSLDARFDEITTMIQIVD